MQAAEGKFNPKVHVKYDWNLRLEDMDESDDDLDDKPSPIKKDRRPQSFCHSSSLSPHDKLSLPAFSGQRDKPRLSYGMFTNQMYSVSTDCPSSPVSDAPTLPPRNAGKGKTDFKNAPVADIMETASTKVCVLFCYKWTLEQHCPQPHPRCICLHQERLREVGTLQDGIFGQTGSQLLLLGLGEVAQDDVFSALLLHREVLLLCLFLLLHRSSKQAVDWLLLLMPLPQHVDVKVLGVLLLVRCVDLICDLAGPLLDDVWPLTLRKEAALRKTIHHPPVDKPSQPPEPVLFQKSPPGSDTPQKVPLSDKPQPGDLHPKPQVSELPPKPGELPPKPQLFDLPPKPQLGDLPPKPQLKDLPPKPLLSDLSILKHGVPEPAHKPPPGEVAHKSEPCDMPVTNQQAEPSPTQFTHSTKDTNGSLKSGPETPIPLPRKISTGKIKLRRVKTIYDCQADDDELTFVEGEVIVVTGEEDQEWWIGHIEGQPERKGVFPMSFVHILSD
ncbi:arf-GAP with SH3 domain, ANK repeat and PH domain-containing protein 1-like [Neoarius graeffei]|uniref:arf-GAP with SH3 domain, ANK repeat and PH domain-containing protein 1-like n=1 Tax=Neoarius graeffei TaxID=443677 RepID=UPI00298BD1AE|nr:arf-GAP with SH3 domain, ANK repeat and PH domain-containing protein 1-like [Neoarius graeffei]